MNDWGESGTSISFYTFEDVEILFEMLLAAHLWRRKHGAGGRLSEARVG